ncbi:disease resistance protein RPS6-like [Cornus florida]|uniref:disease resistance protein RPS6-like n=1 Tax=Cornus florida TaxID=4283 RepID=UPI0028981905|nr:disease resistance protein RPS6-like [Cornus florida]
MLLKLEELDASNCSNLGVIPSNIEKRSSLRILRLDWTDIRSLPTSICGLPHLQTLELQGCKKLQFLPELPSSLVSLRVTCKPMETFLNLPSLINLKVLLLFYWPKLLKIPKDIVKLAKLETLTLDDINISSLPMELGALSRLKELTIIDCEQIQCLPTLPSSLIILHLRHCSSMNRLPDLSNLKNLSELKIWRCLELIDIQGLGRLELLIDLDLYGRESLETLPDLSNLKKLRKIDTSECKNLNEIRGLDRLESLEYLNMSECKSLERLPDLSRLEMLKELKLSQCQKLREIEGLEALKSLNRVYLTWCTALERIPDLSSLTDLDVLDLGGCEKLGEISGCNSLFRFYR